MRGPFARRNDLASRARFIHKASGGWSLTKGHVVTLGLLLRGLSLALITATSLSAEPYRLVPGDRIEVSQAIGGQASPAVVDIDGQVRVAGAGGVTVAGTTLDEAERRIEAAIAEAGVYLNPDVSLVMLDYAPLIIAGDVRAPGRYDYIPGLTVAGALALTGGGQLAGDSRAEVERARIENEGQLRDLNLLIAGAVLEMARLDALLQGAEVYEVAEVWLARIPRLAAVPLEDLRRAEEAQFEANIAFNVDALASFDTEIALIEDRLVIYDARRGVQEEVLARAIEELATARDLRTRGLQTAPELAQAEAREATARAGVLEIETLRVTATKIIAEARRGRIAFHHERREGWLARHQDLTLRLEQLESEYRTRSERQVSLTGLSAAAVTDDLVSLEFAILRPGIGTVPEPVTEATPLRPGDLLTVTQGAGE